MILPPLLAVKQPWAHLIVHGAKDVENRAWRTGYRGRIVIVASLLPDLGGWGHVTRGDRLAFGAAIGVVELTDVVRDHASSWAQRGSWHWVLGPARCFELPIAVRGQRGLFTVPQDAELPLRRQLRLVAA